MVGPEIDGPRNAMNVVMETQPAIAGRLDGKCEAAWADQPRGEEDGFDEGICGAYVE